jgi:hypothetical protein
MNKKKREREKKIQSNKQCYSTDRVCIFMINFYEYYINICMYILLLYLYCIKLRLLRMFSLKVHFISFFLKFIGANNNV